MNPLLLSRPQTERSSAMPNAPALLSLDGNDSAGKTLALPRDGLDLHLALAADQELDSACTLSLKPAPGSGAPVALEELKNAAVSCDQGVFPNSHSVAWLLADWGAERPLASIHVQTATPGKARVKVFSNGGWSPLYPIDIIATGGAQGFSPVVVGKVMIELVTAGAYPGLWESVPVAVTGLVLQAATLPGDLGLTVAGQAFGFRLPGLLPTVGVTVEGFAAAVNAYLADPKALRPVPLHLSAGLPGQLQLQFSPAAVTVIRQLDGNTDGVLPLSWQGEAAASSHGAISLPNNSELKAFGCTVDVEFPPEKLLFPPAPKTVGRAQFAAPLADAAQGFHTDPQGPALCGLDLKLSLRGPELVATLALHPDLHGRPAPVPYSGAVLPIHWQAGADPRGADGWLSLTLLRPVQLPDADWWAVLTVQQGAVLWELATEPPDEAGACLYRKGDGAWLNRGAQEWAQTRLRVASPKPSVLTGVTVQRGTTEVSLAVDETGRVQADAMVLNKLNSDKSAELEIRLKAAAAGYVTLRELRVVYR